MTQARPGGNGLDRETGTLQSASAAGPAREGSEPVARSIEEDDTLDFLEESDEVTDEHDE